MSDSKISVLVPCYNLGAFLDEAVESVYAQDHDNVEILVVDDGSTDPATIALLADYSRPKVRIFRTENGGPARARNVALAHATGDYLCALDPDDRLVPGCFAKAAAILDTDPSVAFVSSWLRMFGAEDTVWKQYRCDLPTLLAECTVCTAALVRRDAVVDVGGFDADLPVFGYEDWDLWISLVEKGYRGVILPEVLFLYRRRAGSLSSVVFSGESQITGWSALVEKHRASYQRHVLEVLLHKEREVGRWLRDSRGLEARVEQELVPLVSRREAELERLRAKLGAPEGEVQGATELERALSAARRDLDSVLRSRSWRLTAPLRAVRAFFRRFPGAGVP